jgi:hypothetical protein
LLESKSAAPTHTQTKYVKDLPVSIKIPKNEWHQLTNPFDTPCKIVEIQYGEQCIEEDIERK